MVWKVSKTEDERASDVDPITQVILFVLFNMPMMLSTFIRFAETAG